MNIPCQVALVCLSVLGYCCLLATTSLAASTGDAYSSLNNEAHSDYGSSSSYSSSSSSLPHKSSSASSSSSKSSVESMMKSVGTLLSSNSAATSHSSSSDDGSPSRGSGSSLSAGKNSPNQSTVSKTTKNAQTTGASHSSSDNADHSASSYSKSHPAGNITVPSNSSKVASGTATFRNSSSSPTADDMSPSNAEKVVQNFTQYMRPICSSLDQLNSKQLSKIQSQFENYVRLTNGKLALCFLQHFEFEPALKPMNYTDLETICSSRLLPTSNKGSFASFRDCAAPYWTPALDSQLTRDSNAHQTNSSQHSGSDTLSGIKSEHNSSEISQISSALDTMANQTDIKPVDVVGQPAADAHGSISPSLAGLSTSGNGSDSSVNSLLTTMTSIAGFNVTNNKTGANILSDPNTFVVVVDDASHPGGGLNHTVSNSSGLVTNPSASHSTSPPLLSSNSSSSSDLKHTNLTHSLSDLLHSTASPQLSGQLNKTSDSSNQTLPAQTATEALDAKISSALTSGLPTIATNRSVSAALADAVNSRVNSSSSSAPGSTTGLSNSTQPIGLSPTTTSRPAAAESVKPLITLEEMLKRQELQKAALEERLRQERENLMKHLKQKQDEIDAQNAVKALQLQRAASMGNHAADAKLHQMEHERQMAADPIGHTIKHHQYEIRRQQQRAMQAGWA